MNSSADEPRVPGPRTTAIRAQMPRTDYREHATPLFLTSSFTFPDAETMRAVFAAEAEGNIYSRFTNPSVDELSEKLRLLEGAEAGHSVASGMAAVFATLVGLLSQGDHVVACRSVFGSTHRILTDILPRLGIDCTYVSADDHEGWVRAITPATRMIFVETPTNPGLDLVPLAMLGELAKEHGLLFAVDNCFATPALQRPIDFGAHLVLHSATKFIDGQGRVLGGTVVGRKDLVDDVFAFCRATGPSLSPFNAWVLSKSLETLHLRMEKHCENALTIATHLEADDRVTKLRYPFLPSHPHYEIARAQMSAGGGLLTFELPGGLDQGKRFLDSLTMCSLTANLGDSRTIVTHPASTTHAKLSAEERTAVGITPGLIRISVGLEDVEDVIADIEVGLVAAR